MFWQTRRCRVQGYVLKLISVKNALFTSTGGIEDGLAATATFNSITINLLANESDVNLRTPIALYEHFTKVQKRELTLFTTYTIGNPIHFMLLRVYLLPYLETCIVHTNTQIWYLKQKLTDRKDGNYPN